MGDDERQVVVVRLPAKPFSNARRARDKCGWIARPPLAEANGKICSRNSLYCFDDFERGIAAVQGQALTAGTQVMQSIDMGSGKVGDVNIIANAGAVGRRV
jgi:hypothetical protein